MPSTLSPLAPIKPLSKPISSLLLHPSSPDHLLISSDDASLRLLDLTTQRPLCAIVGLPEEVSSMVFEKRPSVVDGSDGQQEHGSNHWGNVWVGCGTSAYLVRLSTVPKFLSDFPTATVRSLPDMSKDEINGLCLDDDGGVLGWCGDDGRLGVVDLQTLQRRYMKGKHSNIAGSIAFIPSKPSTLLSIGYDTTARTWDTSSTSILDFLSLTPPAGTQSNNLSPAFPLSLATYLHRPITATATEGEEDEPLIAVGTADGSIWVTLPSELKAAESAEGKKDKRKKGKKAPWKGIQEGALERVEVGLGPIVHLAYIPSPPSQTEPHLPYLLTLSHLGVLTIHQFGPSSQYRMDVSVVRTWSTTDVVKCNTLAVSFGGSGTTVRVVVGGVGEKGDGRIEGWDVGFD